MAPWLKAFFQAPAAANLAPGFGVRRAALTARMGHLRRRLLSHMLSTIHHQADQAASATQLLSIICFALEDLCRSVGTATSVQLQS